MLVHVVCRLVEGEDGFYLVLFIYFICKHAVLFPFSLYSSWKLSPTSIPAAVKGNNSPAALWLILMSARCLPSQGGRCNHLPTDPRMLFYNPPRGPCVWCVLSNIRISEPSSFAHTSCDPRAGVRLSTRQREWKKWWHSPGLRLLVIKCCCRGPWWN